MPELFRLEEEEFSEKDNEWWWTYQCLFVFTFNLKTITKITITDHIWKKKGRELITKELILNILKSRLNGQKMEFWKKHSIREVFVWDWATYQGRTYHFTFWFKDYSDNHLWIRNCYPIS